MFIIESETLYSQEFFQIEHLSVEQGLSQGSVWCIHQDKEGFLWFGTQDGLNRYDGITMKEYRNNPLDTTTLSDNFVTAIAEDPDGNLWVGTKNGLNKLSKTAHQNRRYFPHSNNPDVHNSSITSLLIERETVSDTNSALIIWVGTLSGLFRFHTVKETFEQFRHDSNTDSSLSHDVIRCIYRDREGTLWIGTDIGLNRMLANTGKFAPYCKPGEDSIGVMSHYVNQVFEDSQQRFWILGEASTFYTIQKGSKKEIQSVPVFVRGGKDSIYTRAVTTMKEDRDGNFWFGTPGWGLMKIVFTQDDGLNVSQYLPEENNPGALSSNFILALYVDRSNLLWIGTYGMGVDKFNLSNPKFQLYRYYPGAKNSLCTESIRGLYEDDDNILWMGGYNHLNSFDRGGDGCKVIKVPPTNVYAVEADPLSGGNILWLGTEGGGLIRYDKINRSYTVYDHQPDDTNSISSNWVNSLYAEHDGTLWAGTSSGVVERITPLPSGKLAIKHYLLFQQDSGTARIWVNDIAKDTFGILWIGTQGKGLYSMDPRSPTGNIKSYLSEPGNPKRLGSDRVKVIYEDTRGTLWVGTDGAGLHRYMRESNAFQRFTEYDGLPNNVIYGILEDERGNLWLSTNKGISKFNPAAMSFKNYDVNDCLQSNEFNSGSFYKCKHGEMFFGGVKGLNSFFPDSVMDNPHIPNIVITSFKKFNEEAPLKSSEASRYEVELAYDENVISFEFAALEYTAPGKNQYAYMMEGFDRKWIYSGTRRFVTYTHLDPGEYTFRVRGSNNDGVWNVEGTSVRLTILPPFYATWWFRSLAGLFFISIGPCIYYWRVSRLKKEKVLQEEFSRKLIERQESERMRIAGELHDSIGQYLLVAKNRALLGFESSIAQPEISEQFGKISSILGDTLKEVRQISHNLRPPQLDRLGLTETIKSTLNNIVESSKEITFDLMIHNVNDLLPKEKEINLFRVVQEGVTNIMKHAGATRVKFSMIANERFISISIIDNGKGFNYNENFTTNDKGLGLSGMAERVKILGGHLEFRSQPGEGTIIAIAIPLNNE
ncbi:MAG: hypothetical protein EPO24_01035 [Bacteroidetes bacterium]|nr:MAG: hypothetical protein EPO24_01035 [Bacteroidota bacterium]